MSALNDSRPRRNSAERECYEGVQTYMGITENTLEEVHFERGDLLQQADRDTVPYRQGRQGGYRKVAR